MASFKNQMDKYNQKLFLPRGLQYQHNSLLVNGWTRMLTANRNIVTLIKLPNDENVHKTVILAHPYLSDAKLFYLKRPYVDFYLNAGFGVVVFDFNGFGESAFIDFYYELDIMDVAEAVQTNYPQAEIFAHGVSFGAANLINAITHQKHGISKVIIENCLDKNVHYYKKRKKLLFYLMKAMSPFYLKLKQKGDFDQRIKEVKGVTVLGFIYGEEDELTTIGMGKILATNCPVENDFLICKGKHLEGIIKDNVIYQNFILKVLTNRTSNY